VIQSVGGIADNHLDSSAWQRLAFRGLLLGLLILGRQALFAGVLAWVLPYQHSREGLRYLAIDVLVALGGFALFALVAR